MRSFWLDLRLEDLLHAGGHLLHDLPGEIELLAGAVDLRLESQQLGRAERLARLGERQHPVQPVLRLRDLVNGPGRGGLGRARRLHARGARASVVGSRGGGRRGHLPTGPRSPLGRPRLLEELLERLLRLEAVHRGGGADLVDRHGRHRMLLMAALAESCRTFITLETVLYCWLSCCMSCWSCRYCMLSW